MRAFVAIGLLVLATATTAAPAVNAVNADADRWQQQYERALQQQDAAALATLFDEQAVVSVELSEPGEAPTRITLTGGEFLQQQRALWRFADQHRYALRRSTAPGMAAAADGSVALTLELQEHHRLFGSLIGQQHRLAIRLENRDGSLRATTVHSITTSLPGQP